MQPPLPKDVVKNKPSKAMLMRKGLLGSIKGEGKPTEFFQSNKDTHKVANKEEFKTNSTANFIEKKDQVKKTDTEFKH